LVTSKKFTTIVHDGGRFVRPFTLQWEITRTQANTGNDKNLPLLASDVQTFEGKASSNYAAVQANYLRPLPPSLAYDGNKDKSIITFARSVV
jgi:hypothetical protein